MKKSNLPVDWVSSTNYWRDDFFAKTENVPIEWLERSEVENDTSYCQLIPYVLIRQNDERYFCYRRHGSENRLSGKYSFGVGGHIEECDKQDTLLKTVFAGLLRELSEELSNFDRKSCTFTYEGIINEVESEVGRVHLGIVYQMQCKSGYFPVPADETKGAEWRRFGDVKQNETELWSELASNLIENVEIRNLEIQKV